MAETAKCSKCPADLDTTGSPKWCKACRAAYQKENRDAAEERAESRGFIRGIEAMRNTLRTEFSKRQNGMFYGHDVMRVIEDFPRPQQPT